MYEKETKTELSQREVSASKELMDVLKEYKEYLINNNIFYKRLFTHPDGSSFMPDIFNKWLRRIYNYSNVINRYILHSIRHAYGQGDKVFTNLDGKLFNPDLYNTWFCRLYY